MVGFVTPSPEPFPAQSTLAQVPFQVYCRPWIQHWQLKGFVEAGNEPLPGGSEWDRLTAGHPLTSLSTTSLCLATTCVKGLNKPLKFFSSALPSGFHTGLWHVLGEGLFLSYALLMSLSLLLISHLLSTLPPTADVTNWSILPLSHRVDKASRSFLSSPGSRYYQIRAGTTVGLVKLSRATLEKEGEECRVVQICGILGLLKFKKEGLASCTGLLTFSFYVKDIKTSPKPIRHNPCHFIKRIFWYPQSKKGII